MKSNHIMLFSLRCSVFVLTVLSTVQCSERGPEFRVVSPDGALAVTVNTADRLTYTVTHHGLPLLDASAIGLHFADASATASVTLAGKPVRTTNESEIIAPFYRQARFTERYNQLTLPLTGGLAVTFRVYDEGCAYRFETTRDGEIFVSGETAEFNLAGDPTCFVAYSDGLCNAYQYTYTRCTHADMRTDRPMILPLAADCGAAGKVVICESDLESYPGMFLTADSCGTLRGLFAQVPDSCHTMPTRCQIKVDTRCDYIARTQGTRTYPWRILAVADDDTELPVNNLVYALAAENRIGDTSWIRPGKSAWEWWNAWGLAERPFDSGINTRTYKAYIDFAAKYGLEYVILDEGWYDPKQGDVMKPIAAVDLPELADYAASKNVSLLLWVVGNVLDAQLEKACSHYADMGIKGFKVDFIDRDDQLAVETVYRLAEAAAAHHLVLNIHGVYKPTGLNRTYPNLINFESVFGLEELKWSNPDMPSYDVTFPFIRMVQGPVDYTPGSYRNASREGFKIDYYRPMSQGTRAHQVAAYIVFDAPLAMLCDSPSLYEADEPCTRFIASLPTVCDRTEILSGKMGEHIVTARRCGETWYVGGMTDWTPRSVQVELAFLDAGKNYRATMLADTETSDDEPQRYALTDCLVGNGTTLDIDMASGGGFALILEPEK